MKERDREFGLGTINKLITILPYPSPSPFPNSGLHCI